MNGNGDGQVRIRDTRRANWFWVENVLMDVFQPIVGPLGVALYNALCLEAGGSGRARRAKRRGLEAHQIEISLRELGEIGGMSHEKARQLTRTMRVLGMIGIRRGRDGCQIYELYDLQDAAAPGIEVLRARLEEAGIAVPKPAEKPDEGGLLWDEDGGPRVNQVDAGVNHVDTAGDDGAKAKTNQVDAGVNVVDALTILEEKTKTSTSTPPYLPQAGGNFVPSSTLRVDRGNETVATPDAEVQAIPPRPTLSQVVGEIRALRPRQGDVSDLREQIQGVMESAGFNVQRGARIENRGDGRPGFLDLWCIRFAAGAKNAAYPLPPEASERIAIEIDALLPRDKSLMKLRRVEGARRVLVLRTATHATCWPGIEDVIALGWPGNGVAEREEVQRARMRVGMAPPAIEPGKPLSTEPAIPNAASVRAVLAAVRQQLAPMGAAGEWDTRFAGVQYERHELSSLGSMLLVVTSPDPPMTVQGLHVYEARIAREMQRVFGCAIEVQVEQRGEEAA